MFGRFQLLAIALSTGLGGMAVITRADSIVLEPVKDNSLIEDPAGALSNATSDGVFCGRTGEHFQLRALRALLAFDIDGAVPAGATINTVTLNMHVISSVSLPQTHTIHLVSADWGEGTSGSGGGGGSASTPGDATWIHRFFPDVLWSNPGGDYVAMPSATTSVGMLGDPVTWTSAQMAADVQAWLDNPSANFGWIIIGNEALANSAKKLASREWTDPIQRPKLLIDFTPKPTCPADVSPAPGGDGVVNIQDLLLVIANWGGGAGNPADTNGDNIVNIQDLLFVIANWGPC